MQTSDLVLPSFHRSCQPTLRKIVVWLLGPCSPCHSHITCLAINHTYIPCANHCYNLLYLHCNLVPIFYLLFTLMFDTAIHACIMRDRIWTLCFLNPCSYILTTPVCYLQYSSFPSTNHSIYAVWSQFINQPPKRTSR